MLPVVRIQNIRRRRREMNISLIRDRRHLRSVYNPFELPDFRFKELYRVNKELARDIIERLREHVYNRQTVAGISVEKKVMVTLRFYATGSYQRCVGEEYNSALSQSAIHNCIHEVTRAIVDIIVPEKIQFPSTPLERNANKQEWMERFGFPGTLGAIDGTHIAILKPAIEEHNFFNRKGFHSINCQLMCNSKLHIINVLANYGGSSHDSFIWNNSQIKNYIENLGEVGWLIGDSGYPQSRFLMTPFDNPQDGTPQARYNTAHIRARNTIERCIGTLKMRFRCLLRETSARYNPAFMCDIIKACSALHNMCMERNILLEGEIDDNEHMDIILPLQQNRRDGLNARNIVVERYFRN